jgi:hypothetical protein
VALVLIYSRRAGEQEMMLKDARLQEIVENLNSTELIGKLIHKFRECQARYAGLYSRLLQRAGSHDASKVNRVYRQMFREQSPNVTPSDTDFRTQFLSSIEGIRTVMDAVRGALVSKAAESDRNQSILRAFNEIPFVKTLGRSIRSEPGRTMHGLDAVMALLITSLRAEVPVLGERRSKKKRAPKTDSAQERFLKRVEKMLDSEQGQKSNKQFAKDLGVSGTIIYRLKRGDKRCSDAKLKMIADRIGCKPRDLYRDEYKLKRTPRSTPRGAHVSAKRK